MSNESADRRGKRVARLSDEHYQAIRHALENAVRKFNSAKEGFNLFKPHEKGILAVGFGLKETISLHLKGAEYLHSLENPAHAYERLLSEFRALAEVLKLDEELSDKKEIIAHSWIVTEHKDTFRYLGFRIDEDRTHPLSRKLDKDYKGVLEVGIPEKYRHITPTLAVISVDEFKDRYGYHERGE